MEERAKGAAAQRMSSGSPRRDTKIKGLVLAAGRGSRLGNAADSVPKCLLDVGRRCIVEHQLDALADAGVGPTALVLGYAADEVRETVGIRAEYVTNTRWKHTNSLYSFWLAREWMTGPTMVLNSDVLFSPLILERLLDVEGDAIAIDTSSGHAREQMKVRVLDGRVVDMRKDMPPEEASGENVGILKLSAETVQEVLAEAQRLIDAGEEKSWLGSAVRTVATRRPLRAVDVAGLPWVEIDFPTDLERARKEVWPQIAAGGSGRRRNVRQLALFASLPLLIGGIPLGIQAAMSKEPDRVWDVVDPAETFGAVVRLGELGQSWWPVDAERETMVRAGGPGPVRIDTRLLDPQAGRGHYVLEVTFGGERLDWYRFDTRPSGTVTHSEWVVGKRTRVTFELPEGVHDVGLRLVAPRDGRLLARVRVLESQAED